MNLLLTVVILCRTMFEGETPAYGAILMSPVDVELCTDSPIIISSL